MTDAEGPSLSTDTAQRIVEALLFATPVPLTEAEILAYLPEPLPVLPLLRALQTDYAGRGVQIEEHGGRWAVRTAPDLGRYLQRLQIKPKTLSQAALETLAIIAYRQPVTRAEIEQIRGVTVSRGTLDLLVDTGWVRPRGRKAVPGRPVTWVTTPAFLDHFDLQSLDDLPRLEELTGAGLFDALAAGSDEPDEKD
ncbi:MAG: SMC-Scp complex subunit ScpB [Geminicoccaceae bacterium]|nr:MAG: SMC-Scp complex subunit ScpB [Geminicoccaceae bacterium]